MARKLKVNDVVRVTQKARRQPENTCTGFSRTRWYGRVIWYSKGASYPYGVKAGKGGKGILWVFTARELDLIERPSPKKGA